MAGEIIEDDLTQNKHTDTISKEIIKDVEKSVVKKQRLKVTISRPSKPDENKGDIPSNRIHKKRKKLLDLDNSRNISTGSVVSPECSVRIKSSPESNKASETNTLCSDPGSTSEISGNFKSKKNISKRIGEVETENNVKVSKKQKRSKAKVNTEDATDFETTYSKHFIENVKVQNSSNDDIVESSQATNSPYNKKMLKKLRKSKKNIDYQNCTEDVEIIHTEIVDSQGSESPTPISKRKNADCDDEIITKMSQSSMKRKAGDMTSQKNKATNSPECKVKSSKSQSIETNGDGVDLSKVIDSESEVSKIINQSNKFKNSTEKTSVPSWLTSSSDSDMEEEIIIRSKSKGIKSESGDETDKVLKDLSLQSPIENRVVRKKLRVSETYTTSGDEDCEDKDKADDLQKFHKRARKKGVNDLTEEARDIEEMIEVMEEEERLSQETVDKLRSLRVQLRHTVPPQHQIETHAGSHTPTQQQKRLFEKIGPIKNGKFTPEEDNIIVNNWKAFSRLHDWDPRNVKPFLYMRHKGNMSLHSFEERQKFVQFLADRLPWRTLYSVYYRFRNLYQSCSQSRYNPDEDKLIIAHMENVSVKNTKNMRKFSELAKVLNRTRASVWRRYRLLKKVRDGKEDIVEWTALLVGKFILTLLKLMCSKNVWELKDVSVPNVIWKKMEDRLGIEAKTLKWCWDHRLHMQLFCDEPIYFNDLKIKLIEYFYANGISDVREIVWPDVAKDFDGITSIFLSKIFNKMFHGAVTNTDSTELYEIVEYLYKEKLPQLQVVKCDRCLPRISYENGNIKILDIPNS